MMKLAGLSGFGLRCGLGAAVLLGSTATGFAQYGLEPGCCGGNVSELAVPTLRPGSILPPRPWFPRFHAHVHPEYYGPAPSYGPGPYWGGGPVVDDGFLQGGFPGYSAYPPSDMAPYGAEGFGGLPTGGCCGDNGGGMMPAESPTYRPTVPNPTPLPSGDGPIPLPSMDHPPVRATPSWPDSGPVDSFRPRSPAPASAAPGSPAPAAPTPASPTPAATPEPIRPRAAEPAVPPPSESSSAIELPGGIEFTDEVVPLPQDARRPTYRSASGRFQPVPGAARVWYATSPTVAR